MVQGKNKRSVRILGSVPEYKEQKAADQEGIHIELKNYKDEQRNHSQTNHTGDPFNEENAEYTRLGAATFSCLKIYFI